ncbi:MAG: ParA family protein [Aliivibrio sp.]|nr:ParA family protein [Aliivibrio sp.]
MIISFLSQKGGVSKSTLARAVAVAFAQNDWSVHIADMDFQQQTSFQWSERRDELKASPSISVSTHRRVESALKCEDSYDLLVVDGRPHADKDTLLIARTSNLVVMATGTQLDDLQPQLNFAHHLVDEGVDQKNILFVVNKAITNKESFRAISTIKRWGFNVSENAIPYKTGFINAQDVGLSIIESRFKTLNTQAISAIKDVTNKAVQHG